MGYDTAIVEFLIENGVAKKIDDECSFYLSYNWNAFMLSSICFKHIDLDSCEYFDSNSSRKTCSCTDKIDMWCIGGDCFSRRGDDVEERARNALITLQRNGIYACNTEDTEEWGYGHYKQNRKGKTYYPSLKERLEIFASHINEICKMASEYPDSFFIGENQDNELIIPGMEKKVAYDDSDDSC